MGAGEGELPGISGLPRMRVRRTLGRVQVSTGGSSVDLYGKVSAEDDMGKAQTGSAAPPAKSAPLLASFSLRELRLRKGKCQRHGKLQNLQGPSQNESMRPLVQILVRVSRW